MAAVALSAAVDTVIPTLQLSMPLGRLFRPLASGRRLAVTPPVLEVDMNRKSVILKMGIGALVLAGCSGQLQPTGQAKFAVFHTQSAVLVSSLTESNGN